MRKFLLLLIVVTFIVSSSAKIKLTEKQTISFEKLKNSLKNLGNDPLLDDIIALLIEFGKDYVASWCDAILPGLSFQCSFLIDQACAILGIC